MCTRKSTQYLQCGHRKYEHTDTSSCNYYDPKRHCCPKNDDFVKENHRLCPDCDAQLRQTSYYLHFKVQNLGDEYVDYDWSDGNSPIYSQNSDDYDERFGEMQTEESFNTLSMDLHTISEEGFDALDLNATAMVKEKERPKMLEDGGNFRHRLLKHQKAGQ